MDRHGSATENGSENGTKIPEIALRGRCRNDDASVAAIYVSNELP